MVNKFSQHITTVREIIEDEFISVEVGDTTLDMVLSGINVIHNDTKDKTTISGQAMTDGGSVTNFDIVVDNSIYMEDLPIMSITLLEAIKQQIQKNLGSVQ